MNDSELEDRIRADLHAAAEQPVPDGLARRARTIARTERRTPERRWWPRVLGGVAVAGAAVVVVAVVASLLPPRPSPTASTLPTPTPIASLSASGQPSAATSPSAEATAPSPSAGAPGTIQSGLFVWRPIDTTQMGGVSLDAIVARPDGSLLGLGRASLVVSDASAGWSTTVWQSSDGADWTRVPGARAFSAKTPGWNAVVLAAARIQSGYVAVGMDQQGDASSANASAWYSADGDHWSRATVADPAGRTMDQVLATTSGLVALGEAGYSFHAGMGLGTAIWTSADGRSWSRVPAAAAPPLGTRLSSVAAAPGGGYLAAAEQEYTGATTEQVKPLAAGVWRSTDAIHWAPVEGSPLGVASIALRGSTVVAVGSGRPADLSQPALAWHEAGGAKWSGGPLPAPSGLPSGVGLGATLVVDGISGMLAIGERTDGADATSLVVWSSADGTTWTADSLPAPLATAISHVFPVRGSELVVGTAQPDSGPVPVMWLATP